MAFLYTAETIIFTALSENNAWGNPTNWKPEGVPTYENDVYVGERGKEEEEGRNRGVFVLGKCLGNSTNLGTYLSIFWDAEKSIREK